MPGPAVSASGAVPKMMGGARRKHRKTARKTRRQQKQSRKQRQSRKH